MMLDAIDEQVPDATQLIDEYAQIVKGYLQEQLNMISQDKEVIAAFDAFLKQVPAFLERPVEEKVTLDYRYNLIDYWIYNYYGYLEKNFYDVPNNVMNAFFNGYLLNGNRFQHRVKDMNFMLKDASGKTILTTTFQLTSSITKKDCLNIVEMTNLF